MSEPETNTEEVTTETAAVEPAAETPVSENGTKDETSETQEEAAEVSAKTPVSLVETAETEKKDEVYPAKAEEVVAADVNVQGEETVKLSLAHLVDDAEAYLKEFHDANGNVSFRERAVAILAWLETKI